MRLGTKKSICPFCPEIHDEPWNNTFKHVISSETFPSRIIWANADYLIIPPIGAFKEGYMLLITRKHIPSFSYLTIEELENVELLINSIIESASKYYGSYTIFEHGAMDSLKNGGCCIDHAHIHLFPAKIQFNKHIRKNYMPSEIHSLTEIKKKHLQEVPYLLTQEPDNKLFISDSDFVVSQYLRQIVSIELGMSQFWDWRSHNFSEKMEKTYKVLKPLLNHI